jgi:DNA polymerase I
LTSGLANDFLRYNRPINIRPVNLAEGEKLMVLYYDFDLGKKKVSVIDSPIRPYFYIKKKYEDSVVPYVKRYDPEVKFFSTDTVGYDGSKLIKVELNSWTSLNLLRKSMVIPSFEADIPPWRRIMCDLKLEPSPLFKRLYIDIETDPRAGVEEARAGNSRILCIGCVDESGREKWISHDDEREMLLEFLQYTLNYEVIEGWNLERFDIPVLSARCEANGMNLDEFVLPWIDSMELYRRVAGKGIDSYSLEASAQRELGKVKDSSLIPTNYVELWDWFMHDHDRLMKYNIGDCHLVKEIDDKLGMTELLVAQCRITHMLPIRVKGRMSSADNKILITAQSVNPRVAFPTKKHGTDERDVEYMGPLVLEPVKGIHRNVGVIDFVSMYPSIIKTFNIGIDTWRNDKSGIPAFHGSFDRCKQSVIARALDELKEERYKAKAERDKYHPESEEYRIWDKRQKVAKTLLMSVYGIQGSPMSRYYSVQVAENITQYARLLQSAAMAIARRYGFITCYGDTDSLFVKSEYVEATPEKFLKLCDIINSEIKAYCKSMFSLDDSQISVGVDLDRVYSKLYLTSRKKKYFGYVSWIEGKSIDRFLHIMGWETRKGDTPKFVKVMLSKLMELILDEAPTSEIKAYCNNLRAELYDGKYDDMLAKHTSLTKLPEDYGNSLPHVRAAVKLKESGEFIRPGDKISYVITSKGEAVPYKEGMKLPVSVYDWVWETEVSSIIKRLELELEPSHKLDEYQ